MINIQTNVLSSTGSVLAIGIFSDSFSTHNLLHTYDAHTKGRVMKKARLHSFEGKKGQLMTIDWGGSYETLVFMGLGKKKEFRHHQLRDLVADSVRLARKQKSDSISFALTEEYGDDYELIGKELGLGFILGNYRFDKFMSDESKKKDHVIKHVFVYCGAASNHPLIQKGYENGIKQGEGVVLARDLVNEPASHVHPETLVEQAFSIEKKSKGSVTVEILDKDECKRLKMGAFLGVAQGSEREPKFIILKYNPKSKIKNQKPKKVCLVGKSITFDSGGLSLKPSKAMEDMKIDMAGGAAVLGVFHFLAETQSVDQIVYGILPACENMPSGKAMRPGDVVTALNGKTAEVVNTDAEGRLALADAVAYAEAHIKPDHMIDLATLTGACMVALGEDITGVFGNDKTFTKLFLESAYEENEQAWELPLYEPYSEHMKSDIADLKNVTGRGYGGAITGALFIGEFVKKTKWIHLDIAGPAHNTGKEKGVIGKGGTGWGVISIINLLRSGKLV